VVGIAPFWRFSACCCRTYSTVPAFFAIAVPAVGVAVAVILRGLVDHHRAMISHRTATRVQEEAARPASTNKIAALGPRPWFAGERTGGVMLSIVDGVEQLQTFFRANMCRSSAIAVLTPVAIFVFIAFWDVPVGDGDACFFFFALVTLVAPTVFVQIERRSSHGPAAGPEIHSVRSSSTASRGLPTLKGLRPKHGLWKAARRQGARALRQHASGSLVDRGDDARPSPIAGVAIGAAAALVDRGFGGCVARADEHRGAADRADGWHRGVSDRCVICAMVLHQGMVGQSAARRHQLRCWLPIRWFRSSRRRAVRFFFPTIAFEDVLFRLPRRARRRA